MTDRLAFSIPGKPFAKGRPRFTVRGGFATVYTPKATREGEAEIARIAKLVMDGRAPTAAPIRIRVICYFAPLASWPKKLREQAAAGHVVHTSKPDFDNLAKVIDALNGVVFVDDSQITDAVIAKRYGPEGRTDIIVDWVDMTGKILPPNTVAAKAAKARAAPTRAVPFFEKPVTGDLFNGGRNRR